MSMVGKAPYEVGTQPWEGILPWAGYVSLAEPTYIITTCGSDASSV
jgi:hypothetical protein